MWDNSRRTETDLAHQTQHKLKLQDLTNSNLENDQLAALQLYIEISREC